MPPQDPNMGNEPEMGGMDNPMDNAGGDMGGDDSTMSIINQLSDTDREAVRAYAESMLSRDEGNDVDNDGVGDIQAPMQESRKVIFTKQQLLEMNENFGPTQMELDDTKPETFSKKTKETKNNTPFSKPKFD
jgi:hypothetical protein